MSIRFFTDALLDELAGRAAAAPRRRVHHVIHDGPSDPVQRYFVASQADTYFRPHRHHTRGELATILRGRFDLLLFAEDGALLAREALGTGSGRFAYELPPLTWHTLLCLEDGSVFLEVKQGPYDPATAVEYAAWAPAEGEPAVPAIQRWLASAPTGASFAADAPRG